VKVKSFLHDVDHDRVVAAIREAETRSSGEIRVHVSGKAVDDPQKAGAAQFESLGMTKTAERNGVLIYIAPKSQNFAVLGDTAIHARCGASFWEDIARAMAEDFRAGRFTDGIVKGVAKAGDALAAQFPRSAARPDTNELSDSVSED
jgi:uncharacterized membrane protein